MKNILHTAAYCIFCLGIFSSCSNPFGHNINISVHDNEGYYKFSASYNKQFSGKIWAYVNNRVKPNEIGNSGNDYFEGNTSLNDGTKFYIKESPGELIIRLDKNENSPDSYNRIKKMCEGVKKVLAGKGD